MLNVNLHINKNIHSLYCIIYYQLIVALISDANVVRQCSSSAPLPRHEGWPRAEYQPVAQPHSILVSKPVQFYMTKHVGVSAMLHLAL